MVYESFMEPEYLLSEEDHEKFHEIYKEKVYPKFIKSWKCHQFGLYVPEKIDEKELELINKNIEFLRERRRAIFRSNQEKTHKDVDISICDLKIDFLNKYKNMFLF